MEGTDYDHDLGYPGQFPYTRGVQATMYRGRLWTMRQYAGMGDAEESNRRYKYLLSNGTTGLSVAFDLPTQIGLDSDSPLAMGEVGKVGVAIDSIEDMMRLFDGINLEQISTSMTINATASILLALYIVTARRTGRDVRKLSGTVQNDVLKEYIARGTYIYPPAQAMRIITDIFSYANQHVPEWNTISISGYHMREAGCTAVQEVAFTLANGVTYVQAAIDAGLDVDQFAPRLSFFFNAHSNFLEEVAKFRAARRMWARIMRDHFQARNPRSQMLRFHTQTAGSTLTAQQPESNIVRTALQAMAAVLGGTQSLHTNSFDEALALAHRAVGAHRAAHAADHRLRIGCSADHRSPGRLVLCRVADQPDRGQRPRLSRKDRSHGRNAESHRARLRAAGDPERRLRVSAQGRSSRGHRRRREFLPDRRGEGDSAAAHRRSRWSASRWSGCRRCAPSAIRRSGRRRSRRWKTQPAAQRT